ncbi:hypothetical protein DEF23_14460 [Marinitenerispora sediminis]|uniref:Uncharacterized protein n=1 Tax=Marinitenerispora sediminis TaxID=1931232 RepID=A0A368TBQ7_9ACTN|nr:hypothetical protein DEF28_18170 [Marinitenerispora sediminis]RCV55313.1 hypothetical protein DEF23_14460 [Marinitenerispora sediminis]RCV62495.1 hypothetical protein DEF24_01010 [Marinitenerispora sediminis]
MFGVSDRQEAGRVFHDEERFAPVAVDPALGARRHVATLLHRFPGPAAAAGYPAAQPVRRGRLWEPWSAAALAGDAPVPHRDRRPTRHPRT